MQSVMNNSNGGEDEPHVEGLTWYEAAQTCVEMGGHLLGVNNQAEMAYIHYMMSTTWQQVGSEAYIGEYMHARTHAHSYTCT
jgi:hypothetical protein